MKFIQKYKSRHVDDIIEHIACDEILAEKPQIESEGIVPKKLHSISYKCAGYRINCVYYRLIINCYTAEITNPNKDIRNMDITNKKLAKKLYQHAKQYC